MFCAMRIFTAILVFMLTAQPAPVGACDLGGADMAAHAGMQHESGGGLGHDMPGDAHHDMAEHDCCTPVATDDGACDSPARCGGCVHVSAAAAMTIAVIAVAPPAAAPDERDRDSLAPSHDTHPYRPPRPIS